MSKKHIRVNVLGIKDGDEIGVVSFKVRIPPLLRHPKALREAYCDGYADGVARMMEHFQPEGDKGMFDETPEGEPDGPEN